MIISDSTTLIILIDLDRVELLSNIFSKVYVPQSVFEEVTFKNHSILPEFMEVIEVEQEELLNDLLLLLDRGESEAIILAKQKNLPLIIDEKKGRKIAANLKINIIGMLGIIYLNVKRNYIQKNEAEEFIQIAIDHGYRISQKLINEMLSKI